MTDATINDFFNLVRPDLSDVQRKLQADIDRMTAQAAANGMSGNLIAQALPVARQRFDEGIKVALDHLTQVRQRGQLDPTELRQVTAQELENFLLAMKAITRPIERHFRGHERVQQIVEEELSSFDGRLQAALRQFDLGWRNRPVGTPGEPRSVNSSSAPQEPATTTLGSTAVGRSIRQNHVSIELATVSLIHLVDARLEYLRDARRNEPEAQQEVDFLLELKKRVGEFIAATIAFLNDATKEPAVEARSLSLLGGLRDWWNKDHVGICKKSVDLGLFGLGLTICHLAGVSPDLSAVASAAIAGGATFVDGLKAYFGKKET